MIIVLDIGNTLLNRTAGRYVPMRTGGFTYPMFPGTLEALRILKEKGHKLLIISKIDIGDEQKVRSYVEHHRIIPDFVSGADLHFCYERSEKGLIAQELGADVAVDDRIEVHNSMQQYGIPHRILFMEGGDDRQQHRQTASVIEALNWFDVVEIIDNL